MSNDNKVTIALVVVVGLLAIVAIIISAVSLAQNMPPTITINDPNKPSGGLPPGSQGQGQSGQGGQQPVIVQVPAAGGPMNTGIQNRAVMGPNGRIYSMAIGHDYGSHEYFDDAGYLTGLGIGLIDMVCTEAETDCRIVWDIYSNCWDSTPGQHAVGGKGLHDGWYDACVGWYTTLDRIHVFQFSQPHLKEPETRFFILPGKTFDVSESNIKNSKIVFIDGWASDEKCLARQTKAVLPVGNIKYAKGSQEAIDLLSKGYAAIFTTINTLRAEHTDGQLQLIGPVYSCMVAGNAIMSRKDNDITTHWNRGLMKLKDTGRLKKYCEASNIEHNARGSMPCIDS